MDIIILQRSNAKFGFESKVWYGFIDKALWLYYYGWGWCGVFGFLICVFGKRSSQFIGVEVVVC